MRSYLPASMTRSIAIALVIAGLSIPYVAAADAPTAQGLTEFGPGDSVQQQTAQISTRSMTRLTLVAFSNAPGFTP